jgi:hypothetical protein
MRRLRHARGSGHRLGNRALSLSGLCVCERSLPLHCEQKQHGIPCCVLGDDNAAAATGSLATRKERIRLPSELQPWMLLDPSVLEDAASADQATARAAFSALIGALVAPDRLRPLCSLVTTSPFVPARRALLWKCAQCRGSWERGRAWGFQAENAMKVLANLEFLFRDPATPST